MSFKVWWGCRVYLLYLLSLVSVRCHQCNPRSFCASYLETLILILFMKLTVNSVVTVRSGLSSRGYRLNAVLPTGIYACARAFDSKSCSKCSVWCLTTFICFTRLSKQFYVLDYTWLFTWISHSVLITEQRLILFLKGGVEDLLTGAITLYHSPNLIRTFLGRKVLRGSLQWCVLWLIA